jgi:hypothetical protein
VPRYPDYQSLPQHIREMLVAVTKDDDAAERFAHAPHKHLKGRSVMEIVNVWFGRRTIEHFLLDLGSYLGVDDMERFEQHFGKKR